MHKFQNPLTYDNPFWEKSMWPGRKKRKKNNPKNSGHFVPLQRPRAAHALRLDQKTIYSLLLDASEDLDVEEDEGEERNEAGGEEPEPVYVEPSLKMFRSLLQENNI